MDCKLLLVTFAALFVVVSSDLIVCRDTNIGVPPDEDNGGILVVDETRIGPSVLDLPNECLLGSRLAGARLKVCSDDSKVEVSLQSMLEGTVDTLPSATNDITAYITCLPEFGPQAILN